jgi:hypothetical protein
MTQLRLVLLQMLPSHLFSIIRTFNSLSIDQMFIKLAAIVGINPPLNNEQLLFLLTDAQLTKRDYLFKKPINHRYQNDSQY